MKERRATILATRALLAAAALAALATGCMGTANVNVDAELVITCDGPCVCSELDCSCEANGTCTFTGDSGEPAPPDSSFVCELGNNCDIDAAERCNVKCAGNSTCNIAFGADSVLDCTDSSCLCSSPAAIHVTCAGNSDCGNLVAGPGSEIVCAGNSICGVDCPQGGCNLTCAGSATCLLGCGSGECGISCEDGAPVVCGDGRSACPGEC